MKLNRRDFLKFIGVITGAVSLGARPTFGSENYNTQIIDPARLELGLPKIDRIKDLESAILKFRKLIPEEVFQRARELGYVPREQVQIIMHQNNACSVFEKFNSMTSGYEYAVMTTERDGKKLYYIFYELKSPIEFIK